VRADTPGASVKLRIREYSGGTLVGTAATSVQLTTSWQQITATYVPVSPGSTSLDLNAYVPSAEAPPGTCFYADDVSMSRG